MNPRACLPAIFSALPIAGAAALALCFPQTLPGAVAGLALLTLLPGLALAGWIFPRRALPILDRLALAIAFSLALASLALLALAGGGLRLTPPALAAALAGASAVFLWGAWRQSATGILPVIPADQTAQVVNQDRTAPTTNQDHGLEAHATNGNACAFDWFALAILAAAAFLRFRHLGYAEFQGDEAGNCLANAVALLGGKPSVLLAAHRPPVQVLLPAAVKLLTGSLREEWVRFPFALAGVAGVWLVYSLTRELAGRGAARVAMALAAGCGLLVAFSRMVQYQSLVALTMLTGFFFLRRFQQADSPRAARRRLLAAAAVLGFASLVHYEALLMLPVFIYTAGARLGWSLMQGWRLKAAVVLVFCAFALPFYAPFLAHPQFTETMNEYQATRYSSSLHFNWPALWATGSFYNTAAYMIVLLILSLPLPLLCRRAPAGVRLLLVWFAVYFAWYMVVCKWPKTHIYTFFVPWVMLAGLGWARLAGGLGALARRRTWPPLAQNAAACLILPVLGLAATPLYQRFVSHAPEYVWTRTLAPSEAEGVFGFPYRRGWKTAGWLFRTGVFKGPYATNERDKIARYYLGLAPAAPAQARTLLLVKQPQTFRAPVPPAGFHLAARIESGGQVTMEIYTRQLPTAPPRRYRAEECDERFFSLKDQ